MRWLQWKNGEFVPFTPPRIGESVGLRIGKPLYDYFGVSSGE